MEYDNGCGYSGKEFELTPLPEYFLTSPEPEVQNEEFPDPDQMSLDLKVDPKQMDLFD
jgi:hypothetical protein